MNQEPFTIESSDPPRARFSQFVSEPVRPRHEQQLRSTLEQSPELIVDLTSTMTLSTDWWRLLGKLGASARRTGGQVRVVGANSVGLRTSDKVGATKNLEFESSQGGEAS